MNDYRRYLTFSRKYLAKMLVQAMDKSAIQSRSCELFVPGETAKDFCWNCGYHEGFHGPIRMYKNNP